MQLERFLDLPADGFERVKARHRVLHDHGDLFAADLRPFLFGLELRKIHAVVPDLAGIHPAVLIQQADKVLREHRFAGAGLTHDREAFALVNIE